MYSLHYFSTDGEYVTEGHFNTLDEALERDGDIGSRWIFYPLTVITKNKTIAETADVLSEYKGKRFTTFVKALENGLSNDLTALAEAGLL